MKIVGSLFLYLTFSQITFSQNNSQYQEEKIKIALREIGNTLLLSNQDSITRVMPVLRINSDEYLLTLESNISIDPEVLVDATQTSFRNSEIDNEYIVEVLDCSIKEVIYSYQIKGHRGKDIVPCAGRQIPKNCYEIRVVFLSEKPNTAQTIIPVILGGMGLLLLLTILFFKFSNLKIVKKTTLSQPVENGVRLGNYVFYTDQRLAKQGKEIIKFTTKESEILKLLIHSPNQIITREELIKTVWEDNGVFVGRSLDMFISKLRKKIGNDTSLKIINIHGVGYKIEV